MYTVLSPILAHIRKEEHILSHFLSLLGVLIFLFHEENKKASNLPPFRANWFKRKEAAFLKVKQQRVLFFIDAKNRQFL